MVEPMDQPVTWGSPRAERADAARNRRLLLATAREIITGQGISRAHIRSLLGQLCLGAADLDVLAIQLTAALDGPLLLYLSSATLTQTAPQVAERLGCGWEDLVQRVCTQTVADPAERRDSSAIGPPRGHIGA
jgi:hypothetical protein